jgi:Ca2+-transporting ATPase
MVLSLSQVVQAFNMRSERSLFKVGLFTNKKLNVAVLGSVALVAFVMFVPGVKDAFGLTMLPWQLYAVGLALSLVPFVVMEITKATGLIKSKR